MDKEQPKVTVLPTRAARGVRRPIVSREGRSLVDIDVTPLSKAPAARPWEVTGSIDVEQLVVWAFRDQRAHRHARSGLHAIEAATMNLEPQGRSGDGCAMIADIQHMGCRVDAGGGMIKDHVHPAAEVVAVLVEDLDGGDLVRHFGRLGGRPEGWREPDRWFRPTVWVKVGEEGQWEWENEGRGKRGNRMTRVIPTVTRDELARRRGEYARWFEALDRLAWRLSLRALGFTVTGPSAPARPWAGTAEGRR